MMKILLTLFFLIISISANAKTIYCYGIYSVYDFKLIENPETAEWIDYYEINDKEKTVTHLKSFSVIENPPIKRDIIAEDKNYYEILPGIGTYENFNLFNDDQILVYSDDRNDNNNFRNYLYFDRISGLSISVNVNIDDYGKEYTTDDKDHIFKRFDYDNFLSWNDIDFYSNASQFKSQCILGNIF